MKTRPQSPKNKYRQIKDGAVIERGYDNGKLLNDCFGSWQNGFWKWL